MHHRLNLLLLALACALSSPIIAASSKAQAQTATFSAPRYTNNSSFTSPAAFTATISLSLQDLWDLFVGPVSTPAIITTAPATPVPSSSLIPPPPLYYNPFPAGAQVAPEVRNESWSFPKHFLWGVAGAAFQIEGAPDLEGRGPSVWDVLTHRVTGYVKDNSTADVADNGYFLYKVDIARLAAMGVKAYSFSLSWSRILPFGRGDVNQAAIDHYNDVINTCLEYNITPTVTLYHWDTPLYLQNLYGGWLSEDIVNDFVEFARISYEAFGDRVKWWFTVNEPIVFCNQYPLPAQYFRNYTIPNIQQPYLCGQSVLLAHSQAYRLGKQMMPDALISYKNNGGYKIPLTNSSEDAQAVQRAWDFNEGWFSDPIYLTGDYNQAVKDFVSDFLRPFTQQEKQMINGSADFYAHDAYTAQFYFAPDSGIDACVANSSNPLYPSCSNSSYTYTEADGGWVVGASADPGAPWLHRAYDWLPAFLHYIQDTWPSAGGVAVTEFGFAEPFEQLKTLRQDILYDPVRMGYLYGYMRGILIALSEGVDVVASLAWSFVDNYEWSQGLSTKFGMQYVNFSDPETPRYYKGSFFEYKRAFDLYLEQ
ncbi:glycoside hydrolase family 1 protein [Polychaeton citri CBS 116435]|uniref:Glycoside hydrolase family 1 protein n=1 Tax=Polychaeton citri CBS 116435 TaxID=1314669 RepID=A0A9P4UT63_9PEZI|nr:glycoside hydrolase family 1 protein [Polychaeton citri CBS 116435]